MQNELEFGLSKRAQAWNCLTDFPLNKQPKHKTRAEHCILKRTDNTRTFQTDQTAKLKLS